MQQYLGIILLLIICSFIPSIVWIIINRTEQTFLDNLKKYFLKVYAFFFCFFYFLLSGMKLYLGYQKENLFESFWNIQAKTYLHYGVVLIMMGIILPIIMHLVFRSVEWRIIKFFDSMMFMALFSTYFVVRKISNPVYCVTYIIAFLVTAFALLYILNHDFECVSEGDWKLQLKYIVPIMLLWIVTIVIYIPNELFLNNASEFPISYWYFFWRILLGSLIIFVISTFGAIMFLTKKQIIILKTALFSILVIGYLQGMILNGQMSHLDGTAQTWPIGKKIINLSIWLILAMIIVVIRVWKKEKADKIIRLVSIYLILIQTVSLGILIATSDGKDLKKNIALTKDGLTEVGDENNIIVFVLDKYDGLIIDEILETQPDFLEPLHDFTYYRNMVGNFLPTSMSVPYLLTGSDWKEGMLPEEWDEYAYTQEDTLLKVLDQNNYDISVYTDTYLVSNSQMNIISNYKDDVERECGIHELLSIMMQCSKYRMSPFILKNYYQYDTGDITDITQKDNVYKCRDDLPFYEELMGEGLQVVDSEEKKGTFKFIHMWGAHPPYNLTEDFRHIDYDSRRDVHIGDKISQAKGTMKIVYEYISQLKELGKYDDATIIITADHGDFLLPCDENGQIIRTSFPICFVKEPHDNNTEINVSEAPICHTDLLATIYEQLGIDIEERTCKEIEENEEKLRQFIHYDNTTAVISMFEVNGNVRDLDSWKFIGNLNKDE